MSILRPGIQGFAGPGILGGPISGGGILGRGGWWDDFGVITCCIGAYQGRGAASYADSLINLANPGTNDLTEIGGGPPGWNAVQGWFNFLALLRCFDTGLIPASTQTQSLLVQFANIIVFDRIPIGSNSGANENLGVNPRWSGGALRYRNGGILNVAPLLATGNAGVAGDTGYRNGIADPGAIGPWVGLANQTLYIGAQNNLGVPGNHFDGDIWATAIYNCVLTAPQMAAVAASMAAL